MLKGGEPSLKLTEDYSRGDAIEAMYCAKIASISDMWALV